MAKQKQLTQLSVEEIDSQVKGLPFQEVIRHFKNVQVLLEDIDQKSAEEIEMAEGKRKAIQSVNGNGK